MPKLSKDELSELKEAVLLAKRAGMSDSEIGRQFGISYNTLQRLLLDAQGINLSQIGRKKVIKRWEPPAFTEEQTTVWSFPQRGDWATHNPHYRGNWSPYIPRNLILKYSKTGDVVLDYFVGGGTTAIEAKLLGRRCIAIDINPHAVELTLQNLAFTPSLLGMMEGEFYEPEVYVGDARELSWRASESVDLICAHPPYAGIIKYSSGIEGDLSGLEMHAFLDAMRLVAEQSHRVLKPDGKCAILIGDGRKARHVVPIGFETIRVFLQAGFRLKELVIKRQHNCKTTGFWYKRSLQHNFLLLAHEYLAVFEKATPEARGAPAKFHRTELRPYSADRDELFQTTSVWLMPEAGMQEETLRNLNARYGNESVVVLESQDERCEGRLVPNGLATYEEMSQERGLTLREIVIVAPTDGMPSANPDGLQIVHRYLLVYNQSKR